MELKTAPVTARTAGDEADVAGSSRQIWKAPKVQRLATSTAELGAGDTVDFEGMS